MIRFVHTADWHIGMTRRWLTPEAQARFADSRVQAIRSIGTIARAQRCDFVVVCGDVFDANQLSAQTVGRALEAMAEVELPVYLLPGNHDPDDAFSIYRSPQFVRDQPGNVTVLTQPGPVPVASGVDLIAVPWSSKHPGADLVAPVVRQWASADDHVGDKGKGGESDGGHEVGDDVIEGRVRILVGHGAVDVLDPDRDNAAGIAIAPLQQALTQGHLRYVALGDRHSRTQVAPGIWYSGTPEVTDAREVDAGSVLVVEIDPDDASPATVTPHRVGTWSFPVIDRQIDGAAQIAALDRELASLPRKDRTVVRLALRGVLGLADHAALTEVVSRHRAVLAGLHSWQRHSDIRVVADPSDVADLGLTGFVASAAEEIRELAADPSSGAGGTTDASSADGLEAALTWRLPPRESQDQASAGDALALLHRLAGEASR